MPKNEVIHIRPQDRYDDGQQLPMLSFASAADRRNEQKHVVAMRETERRGLRRAARHAEELFVYSAEVRALERAALEVKLSLRTMVRDSEELAGDNTYLRAQYGLIDGRLAERLSQRLVDWPTH